MRNLAVASIAIVLLLLGGCIGGEPASSPQNSSDASGNSSDPGGTGDPGSSDSQTPTGEPTGSSDPSTEPPVNEAPTANLTASATSGDAPLSVTFTVDGSDPDGDPLSWSLDANGDGTEDANGTTVPADVEFSFSTAGVFNATVNVTDGSLESSAQVSITVTEAPPPPFVITASFDLFDPTARCSFGSEGLGGNWHVYSPDLTGWTFTVTPAATTWNVNFVAPDAVTYVGPTQHNTGTVPAGAAEVDICTSAPGAGGTYTFTATAP